ncbi:MAG: TRAP transporter small permease [Peptococcales bacterium]|jgi:TRAP-type C4-dicarboxylate transport system permease small subunit
MKKLLVIMEKVIDYLEVVIILSIIAVIGAQIISRTFFNKPLMFPEEVAMFLMIALVFIGISVVERHDSHLNVSFLTEKLPESGQKIVMLLGKALTLAMVIFIILGEKELLPRISSLKTTAAGIPYLWIHSLMMVFSVIWGIVIIYNIYQLIMGNEV